MTRPRGFHPWRPRKRAQALLEAVFEVIEQYREYLPLTLRQVFYRLVVNSALAKTEAEYERLIETMNRARRAELISFDVIRDDGHAITGNGVFSDMEAIDTYLQRFAEQLRIDRQRGQPQRIQVWCEAGGMVPQLERICDPFGVPVRSSGGFDSVTTKHDVAMTLSDRRTMILHLGDHDPSGVHIFSSLAEDVKRFCESYGGEIDFYRLAVTPEQITAYDLPTAPPKKTDNRSFTGETAQCEALDPAVLAEILQTAMESRIDGGIYHDALTFEQQCRTAVQERIGAS